MSAVTSSRSAVGTATRRFADPGFLPGTKLRFDQVLPAARFLDASDGRPVRPTDFRQRRALVLAFVHDRCAECATWIRRALEAVAGRPDAEVRVVAPRVGPGNGTPPLWLDPDDARSRLLADPDVPAVLLVDRYGAIQDADTADDHRLPPSEELVAALDHLAMQCPECSV